MPFAATSACFRTRTSDLVKNFAAAEIELLSQEDRARLKSLFDGRHRSAKHSPASNGAGRVRSVFHNVPIREEYGLWSLRLLAACSGEYTPDGAFNTHLNIKISQRAGHFFILAHQSRPVSGRK